MSAPLASSTGKLCRNGGDGRAPQASIVMSNAEDEARRTGPGFHPALVSGLEVGQDEVRLIIDPADRLFFCPPMAFGWRAAEAP